MNREFLIGIFLGIGGTVLVELVGALAAIAIRTLRRERDAAKW